MAEESLTLKEVGLDFGPDPFGVYAAVDGAEAFIASPEFWAFCGLMAAVVIYAVWVWRRRSAARRDAVVIGKGREFQLVQRRVQTLKDLKARDPAFNEAEFLRRAEAAYGYVQKDWNAHDLKAVRAFISDGMHERLRRQIAEQEAFGQRHLTKEAQVLGAEALGYALGRHYDSISVRFKVEANLIRVERASETVLESRRERFEEIWTFMRRSSAKTRGKDGPMEGLCPSCGAPLKIADAGRCEACKIWVTAAEHDWILTEITAPWEWRFPDPQRDVSGWEEMRARDPNVSLEALEDLAAVAFWRWLDAKRRHDPGPLRRLATEECLLSLEGEYRGGAQLGASETVAFECAEDFDRAHVQMRWEESGGRRHTDYLVLRRKAGEKDDARAGLCANRCVSCGAAPEDGDAPSCEYCGNAFTQRGWRLERIEGFGEWKRPGGVGLALAMPSTDWGDGMSVMEAVSALAACLAADGEFHHMELEYLNAYAERRGLKVEQLEAVVLAAREGRLPFEPERGTDASLLRGLIRVSLADGFVEESERVLLLRVARGAGLHALELDELIAAERAALAARARDLLKRLG